MQTIEAKVAVIGEGKCGKTLLCHRFEEGAKWSTVKRPGAIARQEFYFAQYEETQKKSSPPKATGNASFTKSDVVDDDDWCDVSRMSTSVTLKLVEPSGVDRSSLQQIIFRKVLGIIVVQDVTSLWEEYLATSSGPKEPPGGPLEVWRQYLKESILFWVRMAMFGSHFEETFPNTKFPVLVAFTMTDVLIQTATEQRRDSGRSSVGGGGTNLTARGGFRKRDGSFVSLSEFFNAVTELCCGPEFVQSSKKGGKKGVSPTRDWKSARDDSQCSELACDGCFFVSCVDDNAAPFRTHDIVNRMVEVLFGRVIVPKLAQYPSGQAQELSEVKKQRHRNCCAA